MIAHLHQVQKLAYSYHIMLNFTGIQATHWIAMLHVEAHLLTLGMHVQRGLQYSVCLSVWVCYLANSYAVNAQVQRKIGIESKCSSEVWLVDFAKNTLFKSYGVICSRQRTLTVSTASRYIRRLETIGRLAAISNTVTYNNRNYCTGLASYSWLATPLTHDVKLWKSGESRALRSVLRNHAEG